ncbi:Sulfurtransferase TusD [Marinobacter litoralis]|uniref:Sulfurtransferase TusD n=1 Tax=Marinobacter litoralis TaxID=187981 RepID=A0A3M2RLW8_9GAMM|nr:sulfurtransferase complex subunit TusD [Marinobacter litoralis]RMJ06251.1 Sulfurtransferase TusD [Marinobacter litoralis]
MPNSLTYTLVITGAPWTTQAPQTALMFARAALSAGHRIDRVFLYGEGVHLASNLSSPPSDEIHWPHEWAGFLTEHGIPAAACIASALRRGLVDETEQARYELTANNLRSPFVIAGLGEWVEGNLTSNKALYFHGGN